MTKPAVCQVSKEALEHIASERHIETQNSIGANAVFNVWYGKWAGGHKSRTQIRSPFRCKLSKHSGTTKSSGPFVCIWFARGACYKGQECEFLHRSPQEQDIAKINNTEDCFGRTKFADNREDMCGVGSFLRPNRTLFVGYFNSKDSKLAKLIREHFTEWGEIEQVRLAKSGKIAFITYKRLADAEFAKEAMSNQTITGEETLVVRWSHNDDNQSGANSDINEEKLRKIIRRVLSEKSQKRQSSENDADPNFTVSSSKRHQTEISL